MKVEKVTENLFWTRYGRERPVLVVLEEATEKEVAFAEAVGKLGIWEIIKEKEVSNNERNTKNSKHR